MPFSVTFTFSPGTTIFSAQTNTNFTNLVNDGNTHELATTGIHGVGTGLIVGTNLTQSLSNKSFATLTQFNAGITLPALQKLNLNVGGTTNISEPSANQMAFATGGIQRLYLQVGISGITNTDFSIDLTQKFYLDGGGNNYFRGFAPNSAELILGGSTAWTATTSLFQIGTGLDFRVVTTKRVGFNAAGTSSIGESALNVLTINHHGTGGGDAALDIWGDYACVTPAASTSLGVYSGLKMHYDFTFLGGPGDTYDIQSSANVLDRYAGGTLALRCISTGEVLLANVDPPTANYTNRNGIVKAWGYFSGAGATNASYNCSVTRLGAGSYRVNWTTDFATGNYAMLATVTGLGGIDATCSAESQAADHGSVIIADRSTGTLTDAAFSVMAIGTQ